LIEQRRDVELAGFEQRDEQLRAIASAHRVEKPLLAHARSIMLDDQRSKSRAAASRPFLPTQKILTVLPSQQQRGRARAAADDRWS
jgi:hypothetical protein